GDRGLEALDGVEHLDQLLARLAAGDLYATSLECGSHRGGNGPALLLAVGVELLVPCFPRLAGFVHPCSPRALVEGTGLLQFRGRTTRRRAGPISRAPTADLA